MPAMKGHNYEDKRLNLESTFQLPKLNGVRASFREGHFFSNDDKQWKDEIVEHILNPVLKVIGKNGPRLDGEFYVHGWKLQRINGAIAVKRVKLKENGDTRKVEFHVFDIEEPKVEFGNRAKIYTEITSELAKVTNQILPVRYERVTSKSQSEKLHREFCGDGFEGSIYRINDVGHIAGRCWNVFKRKDFQQEEYEIIGMNEGRETDKGGRHVGRLGALVCKTETGEEFSCGSGFDDEERDYLWRNSPVGKWASVKYLDLSENGVPQLPIFLEIRESKSGN